MRTQRKRKSCMASMVLFDPSNWRRLWDHLVLARAHCWIFWLDLCKFVPATALRDQINKTINKNIGIFHRETGVTGKITVNGKSRSSNSTSFRNVSAYIHQDDALRPYLTVREVMTVASHLKLGFNVTKAYKKRMVRDPAAFVSHRWPIEFVHSSIFLLFWFRRLKARWRCSAWRIVSTQIQDRCRAVNESA